ncbi:septum formation initiator family protein [Streptacidiphilus sp. ASG 303]|uniref:FtsB family cell division protein n=1 Tax=Streptacidiphilus sp. ASG 303 TaxID=2896847 RepID=UPI00272C93E6|nr:septum formation initiator family protein [Streptacidiphilus sp. ASG 303]
MAIRKAAAPGRGPGAAGARPRFTGRAAVLALVLCSLVAILAYPTRQFIAQRADIAARRAAAAQARERVDELRREKARWQDPAYVRAQARARLHYALPGETPYVSVDPDAGGTAGAGEDPGGAASSRGAARPPWYTGVWDSVDAADHPDRPAPRS